MSTNTKTTSNQFVDPSMPVAPPVGGYESSKLYAYNAHLEIDLMSLNSQKSS